MTPLDPDTPAEGQETALPQPAAPLLQPKPWQKQPPQPGNGGNTASDGVIVADGGSLIEGVADAGSAAVETAIELGGVALDAAGTVAETAGSVLEGAGSALESAGGCAEGCGGCSLAILITLFVAAGTAMALYR